jgi:hypothetical protein
VKKIFLLLALLTLWGAKAQAVIDPLGSAFAPVIDTNPADYPSNIWITDTLQKVRQDSGSPGSFHWGTFYGTQNEFVDFQVHFHDTGAGTANLSVTASNFVQSSPASFTISAASTNVLVYREAYMNVTQKTSIAATYYNATGQYPDILIPAVDPYHSQTTNAWPFTVAAGKNQSAWVDVHIPSAAPSGYYLGSVVVKSGSTVLATMPVILAVWQWPSAGSMPSTSSLQYVTQTGFSDLCVQAYGSYAGCSVYPGASGSSDQAITLIQEDFGKLLLDHRMGTVNPIYPPYTTVFTGLETNYGPLFNGTAGTILAGAKLKTVQYPNSGTTNVQDWETEFQAKGWLSTLFNYNCDEPPNGCAWSAINPKATALHAATPPQPSLVTTNIASATANGVLNGIDWMVPIINDMDPQGGSLQRSAYNTWLAGNAGPTRQLFSYQSCESAGTCGNGTTGGSTATWPNYDADGKPAANRAMEWLTYAHTQTGELYYGTTIAWSSFGSDPWNSIYAFGGWGDGTLLYPGVSSKIGTVATPIFLPSVRLKHIRDGMQDYEYLNVLNSNGKSAFATSQLNSWVTNSYTFETSGSGLALARSGMGTTMHALSFPPVGTVVYIAQNSTGANDGSSCVNAKAVSYFNTAGNWSLTPTGIQIGPDTVVHLCGTFTGAAGANMLTAQGSGTSGHPITIVFEPGANLTSPAWAGNQTGAITLTGSSYIIVDGGTTCGWVNNALVPCNGTIQNTSAGTAFTTPDTGLNQGCGAQFGPGNFSFCSDAIWAVNCSPGCEIRNLTIKNMYVRTSQSDFLPNAGSVNGANIFNSVGFHIHNCVITDTGWAIHYGEFGDNTEIDHTYFANMDHGLAGGSQGSGAHTVSGYLFHDNFFGDMRSWDGSTSFHHDGIHIWTNGGTASPQILNASVYNNTFSANPGTFGNGFNAFLFTEGASQNLHVFNNLFIGDPTNVNYGREMWLFVNTCAGSPTVCTNSTGAVVVNNTLLFSSGSFALQTFGGGGNSGGIYKNNVISNVATFADLRASTTPSVDNNYYEIGFPTGNSFWYVGATSTNDFPTWKGTGSDTHGFYSASTSFVNSNGTLKANSPAINLGANLTSLGIAALNSDINGNVRSSTGPWTAGAFNFSGSPPPPTPGLQITPNPSSYGSVNVGSASSPVTLTVTSIGTATATLGNPIATFNDPEFALTGGTCTANQSLVVGATCTLTVVFSPTSAGVKNATIVTGANATASAGLSGTGASGTATMSVTPSSWNFGNVTQGTASAVQIFTITNTSVSASVTMATPVTTFSGTNAADFTLSGASTNTCVSGMILAPGGTCQKPVIVTPSMVGAESATVTFSATTASASATLTATGTATSTPSILVTPRPVTFADTVVGSTSASVTATVTNNGNVSLTLTGTPITLTGDFSQTGTTCTPSLVMAVGATCTVTLNFTPAAVGARTGTIVASSTTTTNSNNLSGNGLAPLTPGMSLTPTGVAFGNQIVGSTSAVQTVNVNSIGTGPLTLSTPYFTLTGTNAADVTNTGAGTCSNGKILAAGTSCTITLTFNPASAGARAATLNVAGNASASLSITGTGIAATVILSALPSPLPFGTVTQLTTSAVQTVTITNNGNSTGTLNTPYFTLTGPNAADFANAGTGTCANGGTIAAGASCTVKLTFTPATITAESAILTITAGTASTTDNLTGTGGSPLVPSLSIAPNPISFGNQNVATTSAGLTVTITNSGTATETMLNPFFTLDGANAADYARSGGTCTNGGTIATSASCTIILTFTPAVAGARTAVLNIQGNANASANISGTGVATAPVLALTPATQDFGIVIKGNPSGALTFTVSNTGTASLTLGTPYFTITGPNASDFLNNAAGTCINGTPLAPSASCTLQIIFTPTTTAGETASLKVSTASMSATSALTGTGQVQSSPPAPSPTFFISLFPMPQKTVTGQNFVIGKTQITIDGSPQATVCASTTSCTTQLASAVLLPRLWRNWTRHKC